MRLSALQFVTQSASAQPLRVELDTQSAEGFAKSLGSDRPKAFVVRNHDLELLRALGPAVIDRGVKNKARPLSRELLGFAPVALIDGGYTHPGRARHGVQGLLLNALKQRDRNRYVIGVSDAVFDALDSQNSAARQADEPTAPRRGRVSIATPISPQDVLGRFPKEELPRELCESFYLGDAPEVELVRQLVIKAARVDAPVLIVGPTGSGKDNVARAIHHFGPRTEQPFVPINTAAITTTLFESELFGYVRGAFTGAMHDKIGLWEAAGEGTLFLDEIGDLDLDLQKKILRALDRNEVIRVGATKASRVKARVVAATNRDLFAMMQSRHFREDLYYRLRGIMIQTPALDEHPEDIAALAKHLWRRIAKDSKAILSPAVLSRLEAYRWPGNVRELASVLVTLHTYFPKHTPAVADLELVFALQGQTPRIQTNETNNGDVTLFRAECLRQLRRADELIRACQVTLQPVMNKKRLAPDALHAAHTTLHYRLHELDLLCLRPLLFHSPSTFEAINRLKGKIEYFHELVQRRPGEARLYFDKQLAPGFKTVPRAIFKEVKRVMEAA